MLTKSIKKSQAKLIAIYIMLRPFYLYKMNSSKVKLLKDCQKNIYNSAKYTLKKRNEIRNTASLCLLDY